MNIFTLIIYEVKRYDIQHTRHIVNKVCCTYLCTNFTCRHMKLIITCSIILVSLFGLVKAFEISLLIAYVSQTEYSLRQFSRHLTFSHGVLNDLVAFHTSVSFLYFVTVVMYVYCSRKKFMSKCVSKRFYKKNCIKRGMP